MIIHLFRRSAKSVLVGKRYLFNEKLKLLIQILYFIGKFIVLLLKLKK